MAIIAHEAQNS